ncbi:MAG: tetratricopeptide repeat protein [Sphaerospermopsis sp. SIO1G1]|nr:tetratricopeptide repeat protein [Sphaerospermopsis sp. SIO1G1]
MFINLRYSPISGTIIALISTILATPVVAESTALMFITEVKGNVKLKQPNQKKYQKVYGGELLTGSHKLRLLKGASVKVICNNRKVWNPASPGEFKVSEGCFLPKQVQKRQNRKTAPTRNGNDPTIPYLITPRNSAILTRQPSLSWHSVAGATSYQVQVLGPNVDWKTQVNQPEVVYSGNQTLQPGFRYRVIVTASNGVSNEDKDNSGFTILSDVDTQRVKNQIAQLQQQPLTNQSKTLALAHLYRNNNLNADAIVLLTNLVQQETKTTAVYQLLGNIYQEVGLTELAKKHYLTALLLAKVENNLPAQAIMQANLGEVNITLGELRQAFKWFKSADKNYRVLGDEPKIREMQQQLDNLNKRI